MRRIEMYESRVAQPTSPAQQEQPTPPQDRSFGTGRPSIVYATPLLNYDCGKGCDPVPFVLHLYYHRLAWKSMGGGAGQE
jgi:hypothetical protein